MEKCVAGCVDIQSGNCTTDHSTEVACSAADGYEWRSEGCCTCWKTVCDVGCWDQEDEGCLNINENQCAEIYGHVEWSAKCNCRMVSGDSSVSVAQYAEGSASIYFSIPAFVVLFRESLEVVIVLVIIVQFLHKAKDDGLISPEDFKKFKREVYVGAGAGFALCMVFGVGFLVLASMFRGLFKGNNLLVFDGLMMAITSLVLSFLAVNFIKMLHSSEGHERKMRAQVEQTMNAQREAQESGSASFGKKHSFLILAFSTGLREGMESVIFLIGVVSDLSDLSSLPIPIITALVASRLVGCCFFQGTKGMKVAWFLRVSAIILCVIAAGFFSGSAHKWQELGAFGTWSPKADRPWQNQRVFDARECCNDKTNRFFVLMRALLGWQDQPTPLEFIAYALYWVLAAIIGYFAVRMVKRQLEAKVEGWKEADAAKSELKAAEGGEPPSAAEAEAQG